MDQEAQEEKKTEGKRTVMKIQPKEEDAGRRDTIFPG